MKGRWLEAAILPFTPEQMERDGDLDCLNKVYGEQEAESEGGGGVFWHTQRNTHRFHIRWFKRYSDGTLVHQHRPSSRDPALIPIIVGITRKRPKGPVARNTKEWRTVVRAIQQDVVVWLLANPQE